MTQFFKAILISIFLFFQTSATAEDNNTASKIATEEIENSNEDNHADTQHAKQDNEGLSELEKEALAAEEAELRESGIYEEPIEE